MRWVCLLLPRLALEGALRERRDPASPFALTEGRAPRQIVRAANAAARALGVKPGQALGVAESLCLGAERGGEGVEKGLASDAVDPETTNRWRRHLADWAYGYSSQVSLHYPHALVFEVESSLNLFGPWPRLEARLRAELEALGFTHRLVIAPNPAAAWALVNAHDALAVDSPGLEAALGALPLGRAGLDAHSLKTLKRSGFRRLGELFALPRSALSRRFGGALLRHLGELRGEWPLALESYCPAHGFSRGFEFDTPVQATAGLAFPLKRLLQTLAVFLRGQDAGVTRFRLALTLEDRSTQHVEVGLLAVQRDPETLLELTRGHLERVRLDGPVSALTLTAAELTPYAPVRRELLDGPAQQSQAWAALRQRLVARLGEASLKSLVEHREHRPEAAVLGGAGPEGVATPERRARPGWLLPAPTRCDSEIAELLAGPERIESGWWDGNDVRRDYYLVAWHDGRRAWVWSDPAGAGWYLHGWFG
ncbi:Y-family DNA polymerase [Salinicola aestuarinus]|uniref:Y-family DNA polymerase n=1 Tax=Salinicola aestuarinus TaxID=1949082 RepID=UPI000DA122FE|nr:DNA polymerase Y family protein [Salinicola aestuarinus]